MESGWRWTDGPLFPTTHPCAKTKTITKDTIGRAIQRARAAFQRADRRAVTKRVRAHSGKHRWVNDAKLSGEAPEVCKTNAEITDMDTYERTCGRVTLQQAGAQLCCSRHFLASQPSSLSLRRSLKAAGMASPERSAPLRRRCR